MKILFPIGAFYPSQIGGPCNTIYRHTCALAKKNIVLSVVTTSEGIKKGEVIKIKELQLKCGTIFMAI